MIPGAIARKKARATFDSIAVPLRLRITSSAVGDFRVQVRRFFE
jgi:hypothetical protein